MDSVTTRFLSCVLSSFSFQEWTLSRPLTDHHHLPPHRSQTINSPPTSHIHLSIYGSYFTTTVSTAAIFTMPYVLAKAAIAAYKSISSHPPPRHRHPPHRLRFIVSSNDMAAVVRLRPSSSTPILLVAYDTLPILLITIVGGVTSSG
jgi:hypothetical protein